MKLIKQVLLLALPFAFVLFWQYSVLSQFTIQVIAGLIVIYLILTIKRKTQKDAVFFGGSIDVFIFIAIVLLLVFNTGGFSSGFFFLLYFLCFGISFVFEPLMVFVFVIYLVLIFLGLNIVFDQGDQTGNLIRLGSFVLISPLAYFFGRELKQEEKEEAELEAIKERSNESAEVIEHDVAEIISLEKGKLSQKEQEKLVDVLEEAKSLKEEK